MDWILDRLQFKGNRDYVQGPDLINLLVADLQERWEADRLTSFTVKFHQRLGSYPLVTIAEPGEEPSAHEATAVQFQATLPDGTSIDGRLSATDQPICGRYEYDEARLGRDAEVTPSWASLPENPDLTEIEALVLLNKRLMERHFEGFSGKWWFVQASLENFRANQPWPGGQVSLKRALGPQLTVSSLSTGGEILFTGKDA